MLDNCAASWVSLLGFLLFAGLVLHAVTKFNIWQFIVECYGPLLGWITWYSVAHRCCCFICKSTCVYLCWKVVLATIELYLDKLASVLSSQGAVKVMAKDLIRTRHQIGKFYKLKSQLQDVALRIRVLSAKVCHILLHE